MTCRAHPTPWLLVAAVRAATPSPLRGRGARRQETAPGRRTAPQESPVAQASELATRALPMPPDCAGNARKLMPNARTKHAAARALVNANKAAASGKFRRIMPGVEENPSNSAWKVSHSLGKPFRSGRPEIGQCADQEAQARPGHATHQSLRTARCVGYPSPSPRCLRRGTGAP